MSHRNYGLRRRPRLWDNSSPWPLRSFLIMEVACVLGIAALVLVLAGGLR
jgi:hypothetical protein